MVVEKQGNKLVLDDCRYQTTTTKNRLNALLSMYDLGKIYIYIYSKNYQWYLKTDDKEEEWAGSKTFEISK